MYYCINLFKWKYPSYLLHNLKSFIIAILMLWLYSKQSMKFFLDRKETVFILICVFSVWFLFLFSGGFCIFYFNIDTSAEKLLVLELRFKSSFALLFWSKETGIFFHWQFYSQLHFLLPYEDM